MATLLYNTRPSLRPSRALSTMLADMLRDPQTTPTTQPTPTFIPAADILETAEGFELHLALPGLKKEAVHIEFHDGQLVISGERANPAAAAKEAAATATEAHATDEAKADDNKPAVVTPDAPAAPKFRRLETNYGTFTRSFRLPDTVNVKAIGAELTDGILRVTLPFDTEKVTKQHIEIR
ncbi:MULTISPECIES: Hsp20/alpha crystallin family protein [Hymenobacter]|uniref:Hsp20/alpha crystallin family protein n=1 Tax=Hymenobacter armeniacus TaxID=2771358 RepID=A0ABR8JW27_9BACT|nr:MULTISPECIES: Hsp20/alpha crystallin family protein [Hymenobacter]MBD2723305.1 Hsp20/alpha crystallin family protein [Hymenobacter armeniacus]MBJ6108604.1 Hsp20/alpha crystallin family protein [Hymenobacter sp. BT523]